MDVLEYITQYSSLAEYEAVKDTLEAPHVALTLDDGKVHFIPTPPHDYSKDYFTVVAKEDGTITFTYPSIDDEEVTGYPFTSISYSVNGSDWVTSKYNPQEGNVIEVSVSSDDKLRWKGENHTLCVLDYGEPLYASNFTSDCLVDVEGNIMSLLFGDEFIGETSLEERDGAFAGLFDVVGKIKSETLQIVSAENLILPATTLAYECYAAMFAGCTSLSAAPQLLATTLANGCYDSMFYGCTSLTTAPQLPATTLASDCYGYMFNGCTSLKHIECLATDIGEKGCTLEWVDGVAENGTFVRNADMNNWEFNSVNGIPSGWEIEPPYALVATYRVFDESEDTKLYEYYNEQGDEEYWVRGIDIFNKVEIDGVKVSVEDLDANRGAYALSEGEHTVVFSLKDPTTIHLDLFIECTNLTSIEIPNSVTSIGEYAFSGCTSLTSIEIPNSVTSIGGSAFYNCASLTSITIPNGVTSIENYTFQNCMSLTSIEIPNNVTEIGEYAFNSCSLLRNVTIGSGIELIDESAFGNCHQIGSLTIEATTPPALGEGAFLFGNDAPIYVPCDSVDTYKEAKGWSNYSDMIACHNPNAIITYRASKQLTETETYDDGGLHTNAFFDANGQQLTMLNHIFNNNTSAGTIVFNGDIAEIGDAAFAGCLTLMDIDIPNSVTEIGDNAFNNCNGLASIDIPSSATSIGEGAFQDCSNLADINIPNGVTTINDDTFYGCSNLGSITIPSNVTSIGDYAFNECYNLTTTLESTTPPTLGENAFNDVGGLIYVPYESVDTYKEAEGWSDYSDMITSHHDDNPNAVITYRAYKQLLETTEQYNNGIHTNAFFDENGNQLNMVSHTFSNGIGTIIFDGTIVEVGSNAFRGCSNLTSVTLGNSVTTIGDNAFNNCSSLASIDIPNSVTEIGEHAFDNCDGLTSVEIPSSVTHIGNNPFADCDNLISITLESTVPPTFNSSLYYYAPVTLIYVPCESVETYKNDDNWSQYSSMITCHHTNNDNVITYKASNMLEETQDASQVGLHTNAFFDENGNQLNMVSHTFDDNNGIGTITFNGSIGVVGDYAFYQCSMVSVELPNSVTHIGDSAFDNCQIVSIDIPNNVTYIGVGAFYECTNLRNVTLGNSITTIDDNAFSSCYNLLSVAIPNSVTKIYSEAFRNCSSLRKVTLGDSVEIIQVGAFRDCSSLTDINIPNSVLVIEGMAFSNCDLNDDAILKIGEINSQALSDGEQPVA